MAQASSNSTMISFFSFLGFFSFAILQPVQCELGAKFEADRIAYRGDRAPGFGQTAVCTYNAPGETTERLNLKLGISWGDVWQEIQVANDIQFLGEWRLVELSRRADEPDGDKRMRAKHDENVIEGVWLDDEAMRAVWQKPNVSIAISGQLEITCTSSIDQTEFESAGGVELVRAVIGEIIVVGRISTEVQVLTTGKINIDYTIIGERMTESEADRFADRVVPLGDLTTSYFKKTARNCQKYLVHDYAYRTQFDVDWITDVEPTISPIITKHAADPIIAATINLQLGGKPVIDGTDGFAAKIKIGGCWADTRRHILNQLGNSISEESHNIVYSTVGQGGAEHDDMTNLSDKDTIYVSATQKAATINLQLGGETVIDGAVGFVAKVSIQRSWDDTKKAILNQLGNSILPRSHTILFSTVGQGGIEHDGMTNLSDNDTIYVNASRQVFSTDGSDSVQGAEEATKEGRSKLEIAMVILFSLGFTVVAAIATWYWYRRRKQNEEHEMELRRTQGTW